jgi:hypothetical protein
MYTVYLASKNLTVDIIGEAETEQEARDLSATAKVAGPGGLEYAVGLDGALITGIPRYQAFLPSAEGFALVKEAFYLSELGDEIAAGCQIERRSGSLGMSAVVIPARVNPEPEVELELETAV